MESNSSKSQKIEEIRKKMKEKRKQRAQAEMNGSWNKSFGKKRRCPNASVILKVSLKSNNRALAKTVQALKQENRTAQDMLTYMQAEQQHLTQTIYGMKQNERENKKRHKEIQVALNDVTTSLLNAGRKLAYAMELNTRFTASIRESQAPSLSDDDSDLQSSNAGRSIYHKNLEPLPTQSPLDTPADALPTNTHLPVADPPDKRPSIPPVTDDSDCLGDEDLSEHVDPAEECIDPKLMEELDLDFDIPMMFTDDNCSDEDMKGNGVHAPKRRTRTSRTSSLLTDRTSSRAAKKSNRSDVNPPAANTRSRGTFVVAAVDNITENPDTDEDLLSSSPQPLNRTSGILNQTFEIDEEKRPGSRCAESSVVTKLDGDSNETGVNVNGHQAVEKTISAVVDMELTDINNIKDVVDEDDAAKSLSGALPGKSRQDVKSAKKKTKLPMKKAKTKMSLKRKDLQEVFQSPQSPLKSPNTAARSGNGLSFRCVPSPVFGKAPKRKHVISKPHHTSKADMSVTSVFDLSDGDTFTEAKSILLPPSEPSIGECFTPPHNIPCKDQDKESKKDKAAKKARNKRSSQTKNQQKDPSSDKAQSKSEDETTSSSADKADRIRNQQMPGIDEKDDACFDVEPEVKERKTSRKSRKSKSVVAMVEEKKVPVQKKSIDTTEEKESNNKDSSLDDPQGDASMFFITKAKIHRSSKKKNAGKSKASVPQSQNEELPASKKSQQAVSPKAEEKKTEVTKTPALSTFENEQPETQLPSEMDLLEDIDMFVDNKDPPNDCDQLRSKIRKSRKKSSIPVFKAKERSTKVGSPKSEEKTKGRKRRHPLETDEEDEEETAVAAGIQKKRRSSLSKGNKRQKRTSQRKSLKEAHESDALGHGCLQALEENEEKCDEEGHKEMPSVPLQRVSDDLNDDRDSDSPVIRKTKKGRKVRLCVDTDDTDEGEADIAPEQTKRRSSASQRNKRQKKPSQKLASGIQETVEEVGVNSVPAADEITEVVKTDRVSGSPVIRKTRKGHTGRLQVDSDDDSDGEADAPKQRSRRSATSRGSDMKPDRKSDNSKILEMIDELILQNGTNNEVGSSHGKGKRKASKSKNADKGSAKSEACGRQTVQDVVDVNTKHNKGTIRKNAESKSTVLRDNEKIIDNQMEVQTKTVPATTKPKSPTTGGRPSRRAASSAVSYCEPTLNSKLRRGDMHTSSLYLKKTDIFKHDEKKKKKKVNARKPLGNVGNTIDTAIDTTEAAH